MPIQLIMFEDRMEIRNPGRLSQNPVIASELEVLKVTENRYSGIPTIRRMMQEYDLQQPEFIDERGSFIVKLYKDVMEQTAVEMDRADNRELLLFCKTPRTRKEISDYLGLQFCDICHSDSRNAIGGKRNYKDEHSGETEEP